MERYELERLEEMKEYLRKEKELLTRERLKRMEDRFSDNVYHLKADLAAVLKGLAMERKEGSLVISYLRSSFITEKGEFYIAYYSGEPFVEEEPDSVFYSMKELLEGIEDDWDIMNRKLREKFIRFMTSEQEEIRRWYMDGIYEGMGRIFQAALESAEGEKQVGVFYGNYMDRLEKIGWV